jgi:hypothetical protein
VRDSIRLPATLIAVSVVARLVSLAGLHPLNWDEIEFFRATRWIAQGLVPYRDFWEHHTPLQWFVFAPVAALIDVPGAKAILLMRWAQVPLWIAIFWLIDLWMRDAGIDRWRRWTAIVLPLTSSLFMLPAVEYRVDVLAGGLMILGLVCVQRMDRGVGYALLAGVAFCLSGFANLRLGPVLVLAMLLARIIDFPERRWGGNARANWIFAGAAGTFVLCAIYFLATGSLAIAVRRVWTDNFFADRFANEIAPHMFMHRVVAPFGVRLITPGSWFAASAIDPAGIILVIGFVVTIVAALLRRWRTPDHLFYLAVVGLVNILFIAAMKFVYVYHLEIAAVLVVPLLAFEAGRWRSRGTVAAILVICAAFDASVALFRGKEGDTAYQDRIMRDVDRRTAPNALVWDSTGFPLRRRPAYRYWFLREIVHVMVDHGRFEPYRPEDVLRDPPAAVIGDYDVRLYMGRHFALGRTVAAHYLPTFISLWLPAPNARLTPAAPSARWIVPQDGLYTVYASPRLAMHAWFRQPLNYNVPYWRDRNDVALRSTDIAAAPIDISVDGNPVPAGSAAIPLHRRDVLAVTSRAPVPVGVMFVPGPAEERFVFPPLGVTLEASAEPRWHVPDLAMVARLYE